MAKTWCKGHISFYQVASVTSCFLVNVLENGLGSIYGVLYTYLKEPFMISDQELTWIGALMTGTIGIVSPFGSLLIETIGARTTCCLGGMIVFASFVIGSQFTNLYSLYVCLGLLPGVGASFFYISGNVQIASMFTKRLPLAVGIASAGNGVGVFLLPLITAWCADAYGWQGGTLILGAVTFHAVLAGRLIKARPLKRGFVAETFGRDDLPFYTGVAVFSLSFLICVCILIQVKCASEERSTANSQSIRL